MDTLWLHLRAPFAAFRWMQAGVWRATSPVIPPSAAWGLVLNLASIETRASGDGATTLVDLSAPPLRLAIGAVSTAGRSTLYQQLHGYPVGNSGAELKKRAFGNKYWIAPARREFLVDLDAVVGVQSPDGSLLKRVQAGLAGTLEGPRYGLPFAGDNNFLFSSIEICSAAPPAAHWYARLSENAQPSPGSCRLTVGIDRSDSSQTSTLLMAPTVAASTKPPEDAWVWTPRTPVDVPAA